MHKAEATILFLNYFSTGLTLPVLSLILLNKGCSMSQLALAVGAYSLTAIILELPTGIFSDRYGRKTAFLLSLLFGCISSLLLLTLHGFLMVFFAMAFSGAARAFGSGSMDALLIDRSLLENGPEKLAAINTQLSLLETIGIAIGSIIGGILPALMQNLFPSRLYDGNLLLRLPLILCAGLLTTLFVKEASHQVTKNHQQIPLRQYLKKGTGFIRHNPVVLLLSIGGLLTGFFFSTVETYWQPHFTSLLPDKSQLWLLGVLSFGSMGFASLGSIVTNHALGKKIKISSGYNTMRTMLGICLLLLSLTGSPLEFVIWYFLMYFSLGAANIAESVLLNQEIPNEQRAGMLSFFSLIVQGGSLLAAGLAGAVVASKGIAALWFWGALVLIFITAVIGFSLVKAEKSLNKGQLSQNQAN